MWGKSLGGSGIGLSYRHITRIPTEHEEAVSGPLAWVTQAEGERIMARPPKERSIKLGQIKNEVAAYKAKLRRREV